MSDEQQWSNTTAVAFVVVAALCLVGWTLMALEKNKKGKYQGLNMFMFFLLWLILFAIALGGAALYDNEHRSKENPRSYFDIVRGVGIGISALFLVGWIYKLVKTPKQHSPPTLVWTNM